MGGVQKEDWRVCLVARNKKAEERAFTVPSYKYRKTRPRHTQPFIQVPGACCSNGHTRYRGSQDRAFYTPALLVSTVHHGARHRPVCVECKCEQAAARVAACLSRWSNRLSPGITPHGSLSVRFSSTSTIMMRPFASVRRMHTIHPSWLPSSSLPRASSAAAAVVVPFSPHRRHYACQIHHPTKLGQLRAKLRAFGQGHIELDLDHSPGLALLTLSNPTKHNALTGKMMAELADCVDLLEQVTSDASHSASVSSTAHGNTTTCVPELHPDSGLVLKSKGTLIKKLDQQHLLALQGLVGIIVTGAQQKSYCAGLGKPMCSLYIYDDTEHRTKKNSTHIHSLSFL